jgi:hypothetical protein
MSKQESKSTLYIDVNGIITTITENFFDKFELKIKSLKKSKNPFIQF